MASLPAAGQSPFIRGDSNGDGAINLADSIHALEYLFQQGTILCSDALDVNDDGQGNIGDPISLLAYLFSAGTPPGRPFAGCGPDPTPDSLDCVGPVPGCPGIPATEGPLFPGRPFPTSGNPEAMTAADLNGDSIVDLLLANSGPFTCGPICTGAALTVLMGEAGGTFAPPQLYEVPSAFIALAVGDLNGDAIPDAVTGTGGGVKVLLGTATGTLIPSPGTYPTLSTANTIDLTLGDVDDDGDMDCVALTAFSVTILLNLGDGSFPFQSISSAGGTSVALGNIDSDSTLDLVIGGGSGVAVLLGNGDGSFTSPITYYSNGVIRDLHLADLNTDGNLDVIAVASDTGAADFLGVYYGSLTGALSPVVPFYTGFNPRKLSLGFLDSDAHLDAVVVLDAPQSRVLVLPGTPAGGFGPAISHFAGSNPIAAILEDVEFDQDLDCLVALRGGASSAVVVMRGSGSTSFLAETPFPSSFTPGRTAAGDLDADGDLDIVASLPNSNPPQAGIFVNDGTGVFGQLVNSGFAGNGNGLAPILLSHLDADSDLDIAMATGGGISIFRGSADATFEFQVQLSPENASALQAADVNLDGNMDLIAAWGGQIGVALGNGDATFAITSYFGTSVPTEDLVMGDVDSDGDLDALTVGQNAVTVLLNNGQGQFLFQSTISPPASPASANFADLDADADLDLAMAFTDRSVRVYLGSGNGTFALDSTYLGAGNQVVLADFNGDGSIDVLTREFGSGSGSGSIGVLLGNGDGSFEAGTAYSALGPVGHLSLGDVDSDGDLDVVKAVSAAVSVIPNLTP